VRVIKSLVLAPSWFN